MGKPKHFRVEVNVLKNLFSHLYKNNCILDFLNGSSMIQAQH